MSGKMLKSIGRVVSETCEGDEREMVESRSRAESLRHDQPTFSTKQ